MTLPSYGVDVDIVTGLPKDAVTTQKSKNELEQIQKLIDVGAQLERDLKSDAGQRLLQMVEEALMERLEQLMMRDEVCLSWISLLRKLEAKVELLPQQAVRRLELLRKYRAAQNGYQP